MNTTPDPTNYFDDDVLSTYCPHIGACLGPCATCDSPAYMELMGWDLLQGGTDDVRPWIPNASEWPASAKIIVRNMEPRFLVEADDFGGHGINSWTNARRAATRFFTDADAERVQGKIAGRFETHLEDAIQMCSNCNMADADVEIVNDPYDEDVNGIVNPRLLCLACVSAIAYEI